jgi:hypothetical protein
MSKKGKHEVTHTEKEEITSWMNWLKYYKETTLKSLERITT